MKAIRYLTGFAVSIALAAQAAAAQSESSPDKPTRGAGHAVATDLPCSVGQFRACRADPRDWYAEAEALFYGRDNRSGNQPVVLDSDFVPPTTLLTTRDLDFDYSPGVRARVGYRINECYALEVAYTGIFDSDAGRTVVGVNNLTIPGDLGLVSNVFVGADEMDVRYSSNLHSVELNFVKWCECSSCCGGCGSSCCTKTRRHWRDWYAGFRYLYLGEEFNIHANDDGETGDYNIRTRNSLFGAQLGTRWGWARGRLGCELNGKAGVFGNACEQEQYVNDYPPGFPLRPLIGHDGGRLSFVGELGATVSYRISRVWAARVGYNLMWIEGVALAPDQLDFTAVVGESGSYLHSDGGVFFHGASVGLEARW